MAYGTRKARMPLRVKVTSAAGKRSWRGEKRCRYGRLRPGDRVIAKRGGVVKMRRQGQPNCALIHTPICHTFAEAR
jgi:hypothetical protein